MCALLDQEFGTTQDKQLASWTVPTSGMLIWFRIDLSLLPTRYMKGADTTKDITTKLWIKLAEAKVLIVPGWAFGATPAIAEWKSNFFRLTYAASTIEDMNIGIKLMGL